jgi:hypothetical protein
VRKSAFIVGGKIDRGRAIVYFTHMSKVTLADLAILDMAQLADLSGASTKDIQNWLDRLSFTTRYAKTMQGKARKFNRDNAVEICLIARLVRNGIEPAAAAKRVRILFDQWEHGTVLGWALFVYDEKSGIEALCLDEPPSANMLDGLDKAGFVYVLINTARLVDRVDKHFPEVLERGKGRQSKAGQGYKTARHRRRRQELRRHDAR